jgi:2-dehydropantoate 2-reductase
VGAGAVGSFLAGLLARAGSEVVLVDRRAEAGSGHDQLEIVAPDGRRSRAPIERVGSLGAIATEPSLIVLAVKMFDLPAAIDACAAWPGATILTIQNGVGAEDEVVARRPASGAIAGSVTTPIELGPTGAIQWRSRGGIALAPVHGPVDGWIDDLLAAFARAGLPSRRIADARAMKWSKLVANLVGNATSALLDRDPAEVYADPALFRIERRQLREALAVMRALDVPVVALPGADVRLLALAVRLPEPLSRAILRRVVGGARGGKMPSLRRHLREGAGRSEVGWLNGAVAREGERLGVPVPVNRSLVELVDEAVEDPAARARLVGRADLIAAAVSASAAGAAEASH